MQVCDALNSCSSARPFDLGFHAAAGDAVAEQRVGVVDAPVERQLVARDPRDVEKVVDQLGLECDVALEHREQLRRAGGQRQALEHVDRKQRRCQRRPQFVAERRQETVLGLVHVARRELLGLGPDLVGFGAVFRFGETFTLGLVDDHAPAQRLIGEQRTAAGDQHRHGPPAMLLEEKLVFDGSGRRAHSAHVIKERASVRFGDEHEQRTIDDAARLGTEHRHRRLIDLADHAIEIVEHVADRSPLEQIEIAIPVGDEVVAVDPGRTRGSDALRRSAPPRLGLRPGHPCHRCLTAHRP